MSNKCANLGLQIFIVACAFGAVAGCNKKAGMGPAGAGVSPEVAAMAAMAPPTRAQGQADTLAYEHTVGIETTKELLPQRMREIEDACNADRASGCTILDVSLHSQNDLPNGSIIKPRAGQPLIIPQGAVVVPGARAVTVGTGREWGLSLATPVIVKYRDDRTDTRTELEAWIR